MDEPKPLMQEKDKNYWGKKIEKFRERLKKKHAEEGKIFELGRDAGDQNLTCLSCGATNTDKTKDWPIERLEKKTTVALKLKSSTDYQKKRFRGLIDEKGKDSVVEFQYYCQKCNSIFMPRSLRRASKEEQDQPPF